MNYSINEDCVMISYEAPKRERPRTVTLSTANCQIPTEQLVPFIKIACDRYTGYSFDSKSMIRKSLGGFIRFISKEQKSLPCLSYEWQELVLSMLRWHLTTTETKDSLKVRIDIWNYQIAPLFILYQERDLIPVDTKIPKAKTRKERSKAKRSKLLGEISPRKVKKNENVSKLLVICTTNTGHSVKHCFSSHNSQD
jgi:hypothetical protein